jgi:hypothetical protein
LANATVCHILRPTNSPAKHKLHCCFVIDYRDWGWSCRRLPLGYGSKLGTPIIGWLILNYTNIHL